MMTMRTPEKLKRNTKIYLEKLGYKKITDTEPTYVPVTYRELSTRYDLSITYLQIIVNRGKRRWLAG